MIRAYIFDMDGTLVDTEVLWVDAYEACLRHRGYELTHDEAMELVYGRSWIDLYAATCRRYPDLGVPIDRLESELSEWFERCRDGRDLRIPESVDLLKQLAADHPVCIVSGSPRRELSRHIDLIGAGPYLAFSLASEEYSPGKPDPTCFRMAARKLGLPPAECLVFEDSAAGVTAAKDAGMQCVALARHPDLGQDFTRADRVLGSLAEFRAGSTCS